MAEYITNQYEPDHVSPPGETLRDLLDEQNLSQAELATRMGRPKKTISEIVHGKAAITTDTALQLELVLGVPAEFWNTREQNYRQFLARQAQVQILEDQYDWARQFPLSKMTSLGMIPKVKEPAERVKYLLQFLGVSSSEQWSEVYGQSEAEFRRSDVFDANDYALGAWLRSGVLQAKSLNLQAFDEKRFRECLSEIRSLTTETPDIFQPALQSMCAEAGVAVAFVPQLPQSCVSGATRWLNPRHALIQLSLRYKTNDHLWFTFFHEAAHVLLHGKKAIFLDTPNKEGTEEMEANAWAADFLIPPKSFKELMSRATYGRTEIVQLANQLGIAPGIVVGRLQYEKLLPFSHLNDLKVRFDWSR